MTRALRLPACPLLLDRGSMFLLSKCAHGESNMSMVRVQNIQLSVNDRLKKETQSKYQYKFECPYLGVGLRMVLMDSVLFCVHLG